MFRFHWQRLLLVALPRDPNPSPAAVTPEQLADATKALQTANDEVKKFAETATAQLKDQGALTADLKKQIDEALIRHTALTTQLGDIEQKLAKIREGAPASAQYLSAGARFVASDEFKAVTAVGASWRGRARVQVNRDAISTDLSQMASISSLSTSGGALVEEMRIPGVLALPQRRMTIRNLIAPGRTSSNSFKYVQETGFTNAAAVVSEGTAKPESDITFDLVTGNVSTIAHWIHASKIILADAPGLQSMIDSRLRYGLALVEENEILRGDGTGEHLLGIIPQASAFSPEFNPAHAQRIDEIRLAILQVFLAEYAADGIVLHPRDWAAIELTKTTDGAYLMANPAGNLGKRLWGLPVVDTLAMEDDEFLVGAFGLGAQIFDREDAAVEVSTEDRDNFIRNMVTIRAEERLALAVYRPEAFVTGDFTFTSV